MSLKPKQHCNCTQQSQPFSQPHKTPLTEMHTHRCTLTDADTEKRARPILSPLCSTLFSLWDNTEKSASLLLVSLQQDKTACADEGHTGSKSQDEHSCQHNCLCSSCQNKEKRFYRSRIALSFDESHNSPDEGKFKQVALITLNPS